MLRSFSSLFLVSSIVLTFTFSATAGQTPWDQKLPFKKATINYTISGMENGTETLYIRNYGKETAFYRNTTTKIMFMTTQSNSIVITTPDWVYSIDMEQRSGSKSVNPQKYVTEEYNKLSRADKKKLNANAEKLGMSAMSGMQGDIEKKAVKILGYLCDRMTVMGSTIYTISGTGIPLKTETNMAGMSFNSVATEINKGSVPHDKFSPPSGIHIEYDPQADQMARSMASQTIAMLLEPKKAQKATAAVTPYAAQGQEKTAPEAHQGRQQGSQNEIQQGFQQGMEALRGLFGN